MLRVVDSYPRLTKVIGAEDTADTRYHSCRETTFQDQRSRDQNDLSCNATFFRKAVCLLNLL